MFKKIIFILLSVLIIGYSFPVSAQLGLLEKKNTGMEDKFAKGAGFSKSTNASSAPLMVANIIKVLLSILAIIFVSLTIYAGFTWMTAQGNEERIKEAKGTLKTAIIGLIIVMCAYSITAFVFTKFANTGSATSNGKPLGN
ncbi:MAG: pilin [Planctomycetes bacterium]|jgi:cytochrome bd-type quinol oxidase subunit 2|nr:pilin [Planctomycetota bacterium]